MSSESEVQKSRTMNHPFLDGFKGDLQRKDTKPGGFSFLVRPPAWAFFQPPSPAGVGRPAGPTLRGTRRGPRRRRSIAGSRARPWTPGWRAWTWPTKSPSQKKCGEWVPCDSRADVGRQGKERDGKPEGKQGGLKGNQEKNML